MGRELFLWDHPVSSYAQKVRIALREKDIPFRFATPKGGGSGDVAATDPNFVRGNHRLEVPTLVVQDDDAAIPEPLVIFDSTVILEYLEEEYPESGWLGSADAAERARARMIEDVCDSQYEAINWALGEVETFGRAEGGDQAEALRRQATHQTRQVHAWLTERLGTADWFGGDEFGRADLCVWPMVNRSVSYGRAPEGTLGRWYERANERASIRSVLQEFRAALAAPPSSSPTTSPAEAVERGLIRREYRDHRLEWMVKSGGVNIVLRGLQKRNIRFNWPDALEE